MNLTIEIYHYSCKADDPLLDEFPVFRKRIKVDDDPIIHLECEACKEQIAIHLDTEEA